MWRIVCPLRIKTTSPGWFIYIILILILIVYSQYLYGGQVAWKQSTGYWRMHVHRDWIRSLKFRFSYNRIVVVMCGLVFVISSTDCHRLVHVVTYCIVCSLLVTVRSQLISPRVLFIKVCPHKLAVGQLKRLTCSHIKFALIFHI